MKMDIYKIVYVLLYLSFYGSIIWCLILSIEKILKENINFYMKLLGLFFFLVPVCSKKVKIFDPEIVWIFEYKEVCKVWFVFCLIFLAIYIFKYLLFAFLVRKMDMCNDVRLNKIYYDSIEGIVKKPILLECKYISIAAAYGIFSRFVICNTERLKEYSDEEIRYIFRHELSHHQKKHFLLLQLVKVLSILYWFNPIFFLIKKMFSLNCEYECDKEITRDMSQGNKRKYIELLLKLSSIKEGKVCQMNSNVGKRIGLLLRPKIKIKKKLAVTLYLMGVISILWCSIRNSEKYFYPYPGLISGTERSN